MRVIVWLLGASRGSPSGELCWRSIGKSLGSGPNSGRNCVPQLGMEGARSWTNIGFARTNFVEEAGVADLGSGVGVDVAPKVVAWCGWLGGRLCEWALWPCNCEPQRFAHTAPATCQRRRCRPCQPRLRPQPQVLRRLRPRRRHLPTGEGKPVCPLPRPTEARACRCSVFSLSSSRVSNCVRPPAPCAPIK